MTAYYNEIDPVAAEWLRRLIAAGHIAPGVVDERDIRDVAPAELIRFTQCHFFAGIGIWSYALRRAGWPDSRPIWTGSCPCQPFSTAGAGGGFADERHLWPHWHWLIQHVRPDIIVGEQVAGKDGLGWHDLVSDDLAGIGYASGAVVTCAAGFGMDWRGSAEARRLERAICLCPDPMVARHMASFADWADQSLSFGGFHIRERQYFVGIPDAEDGDGGTGERRAQEGTRPHGQRGVGLAGGGADDGLGFADGTRRPDRLPEPTQREEGIAEKPDNRSYRLSRSDQGEPGAKCSPVGLADSDGGHASPERELGGWQQRPDPEHDGVGRGRGRGSDDQAAGELGSSQDHNRRGDFDWLFCRDGEWRSTESCPQPVVDAITEELGPIRPEVQKAVEEEIDAAFPAGSAAPILRDLLQGFAEATIPEIGSSRIPRVVWQAAVLLAFVRQLATQGWTIAQGIPLSGAEVQAKELFSLWNNGALAGPSHRRGLDEQRSDQSPDLVHPLSQILARHAEAAWGFAADSYAESGFPLSEGAEGRIGRLRAYGNALDVETAQAFVRTVMEIIDERAAA